MIQIVKSNTAIGLLNVPVSSLPCKCFYDASD